MSEFTSCHHIGGDECISLVALVDADRECESLRARIAELEAKHQEWMKRIQREREEEFERVIKILDGSGLLHVVTEFPDKPGSTPIYGDALRQALLP